MVQARLERLDPEARRVLRAASVFGQRFWRGGVTELVGGAQVDGALGALSEGELITRAEGSKFQGEIEHSFRHGFVREAAYGMLTEQDRATGHRLAGAWLEAAGEGAASVLAEHAERGGERARAAVWSRRAAEQAFEGNDLALALSWAERALACAAGEASLDEVWRGEVHLLLARTSLWRGQAREGMRSGLEAMRRLPRGSASWYRAVAEVALASGRGHEPEQLEACFSALLAPDLDGGLASAAGGARTSAADGERTSAPDGERASVPDGEGATAAEGERAAAAEGDVASAADGAIVAARAWALAEAARIGLLVRGIAPAPEAMLRKAEEAAARIPEDPAVSTEVRKARLIHAMMTGDLSGAIELAERSRASWRKMGDLRNAGAVDVNVAYLYLQLGLTGAAEPILRGAMQEAERFGLSALRASAQQNLGVALTREGRLDEARALVEESVRLAREDGDRRQESFGQIYLARIALAAGDHERALREVGAVLEGAAPGGIQALALAVCSAVHLASSRPSEALSTARRAMELLASLGEVEEGETSIRLAFVEAHRTAGDLEAARAAAAEARSRLLASAAKIADPELRRSFLTRVPENARILDLARELTGQAVEMLEER
jgi:tetratricopeptide (TPR) repeat protein